MKRILILCDAHDCIRYEQTHARLLKQLYVIAFLLKTHFSDGKYLLHINNRALIGFEVFWKKGSRFCNFLQHYTLRKRWDEIDMQAYDIVISAPEYHHELQTFLLKTYGIGHPTDVYSLLEFQYTIQTTYKSASILFDKGGIFELDRSEQNESALAELKQDLDLSLIYFSVDLQETFIPNMHKLLEKNNARLEIDKIRKLLILDDYRRSFFIGDSACWVRKIWQLADMFTPDCDVRINVANNVAYNCIAEVFQPSLPKNIAITNYSWSEIEPQEFEMVLCNADLLLKWIWHTNEYGKIVPDHIPFYSFSVGCRRAFTDRLTMDFYSNLSISGFPAKITQSEAKYDRDAYKEISLSEGENAWASQWLRKHDILAFDKLVVLFRGASFTDKVMPDTEIIKLIKAISGTGENVKILCVSEKMEAGNQLADETASCRQYGRPVIVAELALRKVMSLLGSRQVIAIIGPCTGLMHLAEGVYSYLLNRRIIDDARFPLLLTYTGKQGPERNYHPKNWWKDSKIVTCCIGVQKKNDGGDAGKQLILLEDCPADMETFNCLSVSAREISSDLLMSFIADKFPDVVKRLRD